MTTIIDSFEQGDVCGVVEGSKQAVENFFDRNVHGAMRGKPRHSKTQDDLVTNHQNVVKVTTYEPVNNETPLGMPAWNFEQGSQPPANGLAETGTGKDNPNTNNMQNGGQETPLGLPSTLQEITFEG